MHLVPSEQMFQSKVLTVTLTLPADPPSPPDKNLCSIQRAILHFLFDVNNRGPKTKCSMNGGICSYSGCIRLLRHGRGPSKSDKVLRDRRYASHLRTMATHFGVGCGMAVISVVSGCVVAELVSRGRAVSTAAVTAVLVKEASVPARSSLSNIVITATLKSDQAWFQ